jgi:hypothetical protein
MPLPSPAFAGMLPPRAVSAEPGRVGASAAVGVRAAAVRPSEEEVAATEGDAAGAVLASPGVEYTRGAVGAPVGATRASGEVDTGAGIMGELLPCWPGRGGMGGVDSSTPFGGAVALAGECKGDGGAPARTGDGRHGVCTAAGCPGRWGTTVWREADTAAVGGADVCTGDAARGTTGARWPGRVGGVCEPVCGAGDRARAGPGAAPFEVGVSSDAGDRARAGPAAAPLEVGVSSDAGDRARAGPGAAPFEVGVSSDAACLLVVGVE